MNWYYVRVCTCIRTYPLGIMIVVSTIKLPYESKENESDTEAKKVHFWST